MVKIAPLCNLNANCINIFLSKCVICHLLALQPHPTSSPYTYYIYTIYLPPASISSPRRVVPNATRPKS